MQKTYCLHLVIQSTLQAPTDRGEVVEAEAAGASLPAFWAAHPVLHLF